MFPIDEVDKLSDKKFSLDIPVAFVGGVDLTTLAELTWPSRSVVDLCGFEKTEKVPE